jgi:hypothetical protein
MAICQLPRGASALPLRTTLGVWRTQKSGSIAPRFYSTTKLQGLDASQLSITKTTTPKELLSPEQLVFGHSFTDHMLSCEWMASRGITNFFLLTTKSLGLIIYRMAGAKDYTVPKPLSRPGFVRISLCVRMF